MGCVLSHKCILAGQRHGSLYASNANQPSGEEVKLISVEVAEGICQK